MDLSRVVLCEVHYLIPVGVKAVMGQGRLHLLRVEEVKVCAKEFALECFDFSLLLQLLLTNSRLIISHYQLVDIRLFLLFFNLIFSISSITVLISSLFIGLDLHLGLFPLLLLFNSVICDPVELYFADNTL